MNQLCLVVVCLFGVAAQASFLISPAKVEHRQIHPFGVVQGVVDCGSAGQIVEVRATDCTVVPCQVTVGLNYTFEIDFVPQNTHETAHLNVIVDPANADPFTLIDLDVPEELIGGLAYNFYFSQVISDQFVGLSDLRTEIIGSTGDILEVCVVAPVQVNL